VLGYGISFTQVLTVPIPFERIHKSVKKFSTGW